MDQFEFHPYETHPLSKNPRSWKEIEPSIFELTLNEDKENGRRTLLQKWLPQTSNVQQDFVHDYIEEIFIVEGDLADTKRGGKWGKGAYAYRKPGMSHGPFRSEEGCLMFITCSPA